MANRIITASVTGESIKLSGKVAGAAGSCNAVSLAFSFDAPWDGTTKKVYFFDAHEANPVVKVLTADLLQNGVYTVPIPAEPLAHAGEMTMTVKGVNLATDGVTAERVVMSATTNMKVLNAEVPTSDTAPVEPNATQTEQLQAQIDTLTTSIESIPTNVAAAAGSASSAASSASTSTTKATAAANSATSAAGSASTATTKAAEASTSATNAAQSAAEAAQSAQQAAAGQVNSDWNVTDTTSKAFIMNKPTNVSEFANDAGYLTQHQDISEKLDKTGDGSNVTAAFTQASTRANIATGEKLSVLLGKIAKWFADLGALAFKSTAAKSDLASDVQVSLGKADTALQSFTETDPTVPAWAKAATKPSYTKSEVGLGNVDNTADSAKPVSTAQQTALDDKLAKTGDGSNVTAAFTAAATR